ncbi:glycosyltransferase [Gryllotalpicola protaetiae]|uniref:Glycosyltransferase n=1 Tax=Gryllotalpicola protaetiae TaxID=2419771 RepID=A0A387BN18_9MICO|nr:glycosyltransferase [Gryllotalpicola protaetiae]AYG02430.1 glycosyltransferase [Gryllotalpicola protaetiae]
MDVTIIVPTFNESLNVEELVSRTQAAVGSRSVEIVFVDDSNDDTPAVILDVAARYAVPVRLIHRDVPVDGLGGAVLEGFRVANGRWAVVMDGDLQHPPEMLPRLIDTALRGEADGVNLVAGSRFVEGGSAEGLSDGVRVFFSHFGNGIAKLLFPRKLAKSTDPMSGFFAVRLDAIDLGSLKPRGFKILLEILCRKQMNLVEVPATLAPRGGGESKADIKQVGRLTRQIVELRIGRMPGFALIGFIGGIANLAIMWALQQAGWTYIEAAIAAAVITIVGNFIAQEHFLYHDLRAGARRLWSRFGHSAGFNAIESAVRTFVLWAAVELLHLHSHTILTQAALLVIGFLLRYTYHERVVYRQLADVDAPAQAKTSL